MEADRKALVGYALGVRIDIANMSLLPNATGEEVYKQPPTPVA